MINIDGGGDIDNTWVCSINGNIGVFDELSPTHKTGYWTDSDGDHKAVCRLGEWINIQDFMKDQGIDPGVFDREITTAAQQYHCNYRGCSPA